MQNVKCKIDDDYQYLLLNHDNTSVKIVFYKDIDCGVFELLVLRRRIKYSMIIMIRAMTLYRVLHLFVFISVKCIRIESIWQVKSMISTQMNILSRIF